MRSHPIILLCALAALLASCARPPQAAAPGEPTATVPTQVPADPGATAPPATVALAPSPTPAPEISTTALPTAEAAEDAKVERLLATMSIPQQVGQLMIVALREESVSPHAIEMIRDRHVGGLILFTRNLGSPEHSRALTASFQELALGSGARIPLFLALDQEGGIVNRAAEGVTVWPSQMLLGATASPELVARAAQLTAVELRAVGMNMNFAPVLDINSNPANPVIGTRSFGADPALVSALGVREIVAYREAGIIPVGKHFPGHGDTDIDSHMALPLVDKSPAELEALELIPFRAAIAAGLDAIMTAHIAVPRVTGDDPATLSPAMLTTILRQHLGYEGVIITDDLEMGAITDRYGTAEAALRAFRAGADLLLFRFTESEQRRAYDLILEAAQREPALRQRLAESVRRILRLKLRHGLFAPPPAPPLSDVGSEAHRAAAIDTAAAGITLVRNEARLLPLTLAPSARVLVLSPDPTDLESVEVPIPAALTLGDAIRGRHAATEWRPYHLDPDGAERAALVAAAASADLVVLGSYNVQLYPGQRALVEALLATGRPLVVVSLRLPYDLNHLPPAPTYLAAYDNRPPTLLAVADALFGLRAPAGHLPVPLSERYPLGYGLRDYTTPERVQVSKVSPWEKGEARGGPPPLKFPNHIVKC